ncbi:hypothetical protein LEL_10931 [Akanthomyces lecanii RCEF 1005]|uniref:Metallo-beta-lactamase domain-containing protein n=1 Tax=Akanthomyces lecanii RCEF 1005 TaxID=1081108 RepID=A0A167PYD4_CORDF|nr:hypothetical protein LEL_10931 [Akanthomyces lecanii RCEF 1005]
MTAKHLYLDEAQRISLLRGEYERSEKYGAGTLEFSNTPSQPRVFKTGDDCTVFFVGTATTIIEWKGFRILTDPNFLHAGEPVHLGPGVNATRRTNPATELDQLPALDCILLSHYHEDHFDRHVEQSLNRGFPIVTTPHAVQHLAVAKDGTSQPFQQVTGLDRFESAVLHIDGHRAIKVTAMPGKHVPPGPIAVANNLLQAVPPTAGWLLELGHLAEGSSVVESEELQVGYRIYISGDTLLVEDLEEIPRWLKDKQLDLMLVHLGGTTIPGASLPLFMVTMDGEQGRHLMQLVNPKITIPIHYDDYDVFLSPLADFEKEVNDAGLHDSVFYLDRGETYSFSVRE